MTLSQALIGEAIPPRERGRYQGYLAGVAVSSNTFGPVAGGYLTQAFGWQSIFLINIPLGLLAFLFVVRIPPREGDRRRTTFEFRPGWCCLSSSWGRSYWPSNRCSAWS